VSDSIKNDLALACQVDATGEEMRTDTVKPDDDRALAIVLITVNKHEDLVFVFVLAELIGVFATPKLPALAAGAVTTNERHESTIELT